jgi:hypothetical protein
VASILGAVLRFRIRDTCYVGNQPARFQVELRYPGGPYSIKQRELAVGEAASFDLRQIRDEQQPDRTGKTLPLTLDRGQFHWSIVATPGEARIIGRAEVVSHSGRVVSSYSCPVCCPDSGPVGSFDPNAYGLSVDGFVYTNAHGDYYDCYFNYYAGSFGFSQMFTYNTSIATVNGGQLNGIAVGNTQVEGDYDYVEWYNDGMDCYQYYGNGSANAQVAVKPRIDSITPSRGLIGNTSAVSIDGHGFGVNPSVSAGSGITVTVNFANSTSFHIDASFAVSANASGGNHAVTVTVGGNTSNSNMNFYVQIPTRLRLDRLDGQVVIDPGPGDIVDPFGQIKATNRCGAYRNVLYTLVEQDQTGQPIIADIPVTEVLSNFQGTPGLPQPTPKTAVTLNGVFGDTQGISGQSPDCPPPFNYSLNQGFTASVNQATYPLSTVNAIAVSKNGSGNYTITITMTTP